MGTLEIDFVATKADKNIYYQVSATILDSVTRVRELAPLQAIKDNYEKIILIMYTTAAALSSEFLLQKQPVSIHI